GDGARAAAGRPQREALLQSVEMLEARPRVAYADASASFCPRPRAGGRIVGRRPVILHAEHQLVTDDVTMEHDPANPVDLAHAVLDRVLDDRLEDEIGDERVQR